MIKVMGEYPGGAQNLFGREETTWNPVMEEVIPRSEPASMLSAAVPKAAIATLCL